MVYDGLVAGDGCSQEAWAHAEFGALQLADGESEVARQHLETSLSITSTAQGTSLTPTEAAAARLSLAQAYWALGGEMRTARGKYAQSNLLAAAAEPGQHQAMTFSWLGKWYAEAAGDKARAAKCLQKSVTLDPMQEEAGHALINLLLEAGDISAATSVCQHAIRSLAALKDTCTEATSASAAIRYQAAIKKTLAAAFNDATSCYHKALNVDPSHPVALLGAAEAHLAAAGSHSTSGALGLAASDLHAAAELASSCCKEHKNLQSAYKLLGDVELQHAAITPLQEVRQMAEATTGEAAAQAAVAAVAARVEAVRRSRKAYCKALHLSPNQGLVWGDLATTLQQEASIATSYPEADIKTDPKATSKLAQRLTVPKATSKLAQRLVCGGLRLEPTSDWLWTCAGNVAPPEDPSRAEYCWSRSLQLNPKRACTWARLGRMSHEPTLVSVWESMGYLSSTSVKVAAGAHYADMQDAFEHAAAAGAHYADMQDAFEHAVAGDAHYADMQDAFEHAVGLGGGLESRLSYAAASLLPSMRSIPHALETTSDPRFMSGGAFSAAAKGCAQQPMLASAHVALGLAAEKRGALALAVHELDTGLALLLMEGEGGGLGRSSTGNTTWVASAGGPTSSTPTDVARVHLARVLAKGAARASSSTSASSMEQGLAQAAASLSLFRAVESSEVVSSTPTAWLAAAAASKEVGNTAETEAFLNKALAVATAAAAAVVVGEKTASLGLFGSGGRGQADSALLLKLRCVLALCRFLLDQERYSEAYRLVTAHVRDADLAPHPFFGTQDLDVCVQMWLALLACATLQTEGKASAEGEDGAELGDLMALLVGTPSREGGALPKASWQVGDEVVGLAAEAKAWVRGTATWGVGRIRGGLGQQNLVAGVDSILSACLAAKGQAKAAVRAAACAVHVCPWDVSLRNGLASSAAAASPEYAQAAFKAAPSSAQIQLSNPPVLDVSPLRTNASGLGSGSNSLDAFLADLRFVRASSLLQTGAGKEQRQWLMQEIRSLTRLLHCEPLNVIASYLLALLHVQHAAATGGQSAWYRRALLACKLAAARTKETLKVGAGKLVVW
eukprot:gene28094-31202_t